MIIWIKYIKDYEMVLKENSWIKKNLKFSEEKSNGIIIIYKMH